MSNAFSNKACLDDYASVLSNSIPPELQSILEILWKHHKEAYIVGGAVRDCLLGFPTKDFDIATNAQPREIEKLLNIAGIKTKPIGSKFGTIIAIVGKAVFDVCTFRREIYSTPKSPEVIFVDSLEEDLTRRDFTFNAIAFDPKKQKFIDRYDGFNDLQQRRIQTIGDAYTRLSEDGTRVIRLARFVSQYPDFNVHPDLLAAALEVGKTAKFCSYTTLKKELFKLIILPNPTNGLRLLWQTKILNAMFPNFPFIESSTNHIEKVLNGFKEIPSRDVWIRLFGLFLLLSEESIHTVDVWQDIGQDLKITPKEQKKLNHLLLSWLNFPQVFDLKNLKKWIRTTGINTSEDLLKLIFLQAELLGRSELISKKEFCLKKTLTILETFRGSLGS